jgi:hypothetical protein
MREMGWSFEALQRTPAYVRRYCWDFIQLRRQAEADAHEQAKREAEAGRA